MKDMFSIIKQHRKMYLFMLLATLFMTVYFSYLNVNVIHADTFITRLNGDVTFEMAEEYISKETTLLQYGIGNGEFLYRCFFDMIPEFFVILIAIAIMIIVAFLGESKEKAREFIEVLPCKRIVKEYAKFLPLFIILLLNCMVGIGSTLVQLTIRNKEIVNLANRFPALLEGKISKNLVADGNMLFVKEALIAVFMLIGFFMVCYLFSIFFKKRIFGIVLGFFVYLFGGEYIWSLADCFGILEFENVRHVFDVLISLFLPYLWGDVPGIGIFVFVQLGFFAILFVLITLLVKSTELSKGKFCCSRWMECIFIICLGFLFAMMIAEFVEMFGENYLYMYETVVMTVVLRRVSILTLGALISGLIMFFVYKRPERVTKLEVEGCSKKRKLFFSLGKGSYIGTLFIVTFFSLLAEYRAISWSIYSLREYMTGYWNDILLDDVLLDLSILDSMWQLTRHGTILTIILIFVVGYRIAEIFLTGRMNAVSFTETLPIKRKKRFFAEFQKSFMLGFIPFTISIVMLVLYTYVLAGAFGSEAYRVIPGILTWYGVGVSYIIGVLGVIYLIDTMVVHPIMKMAYLVCLTVFGGMVTVMIDSMFTAFGITYLTGLIFSAVVSFVFGIMMIITASVLYEKREIEKDKFCFKFAAYGFAFLVTGIFDVFMLASMKTMKLYIFIPIVLLGSISIFMLVGNCCIPEISALIGRYSKKKKEL